MRADRYVSEGASNCQTARAETLDYQPQGFSVPPGVPDLWVPWGCKGGGDPILGLLGGGSFLLRSAKIWGRFSCVLQRFGVVFAGLRNDLGLFFAAFRNDLGSLLLRFATIWDRFCCVPR